MEKGLLWEIDLINFAVFINIPIYHRLQLQALLQLSTQTWRKQTTRESIM